MITRAILTLLCAALAASTGAAAQECAEDQIRAAFTEGIPNDPHYHRNGSLRLDLPDQWGLVEVDAYPLAAPNDPLQPVIVAVIDTGIDLEHPDLDSRNLWRNHAEEVNGQDDDGNGYVDDLIGWNFVDGDNVPWDHSGHGTHVAGIIAAATDNGRGIAGLNPVALIMPLKVANFVGHAEGAALAAAIYYAVEMKAAIINLSMGGRWLSEAEQDALNRARLAGVLVVTAAGNTAQDAGAFGYAGAPGVYTVAATAPGGERASFSNYGHRVDAAAPGVEILSLRARNSDFIRWTVPVGYSPEAAVVGENAEYYRASGTSFAAAMVTGVASRVLAERPQLTDVELRRILSQSAADLGVPGVDQATGYGLVNLKAALQQPADEYVEARLSDAQLAYRDERVLLGVFGQADAQHFKSAELTYALESEPQVWQPFGGSITAPVTDGLLAEVDLEPMLAASAGRPNWMMKLVVEDEAGARRESRLHVQLPVPQPVSADAEPGGSGE
jgi:subtilisin family serine protease